MELLPSFRVLDGKTGTVSLPNVGTFGFVPVVHGDESVTVTVQDLTNGHRKQISEVALAAGDIEQTNTTPNFSIRVVRVDRAPIPLKFIGLLEEGDKGVAILADSKVQLAYASAGQTVWAIQAAEHRRRVGHDVLSPPQRSAADSDGSEVGEPGRAVI